MQIATAVLRGRTDKVAQLADGAERIGQDLVVALGRGIDLSPPASRAASRTPTCTTRTFELACERQDPWACVMLSRALIDGRGTARDLDRAAAVLSAACRYGDDDPACQTAKDTEELIRTERAAAP